MSTVRRFVACLPAALKAGASGPGVPLLVGAPSGSGWAQMCPQCVAFARVADSVHVFAAVLVARMFHCRALEESVRIVTSVQALSCCIFMF